MSRRTIKRDILEKGLDPTIPYSLEHLGDDGTLLKNNNESSCNNIQLELNNKKDKNPDVSQETPAVVKKKFWEMKKKKSTATKTE